MQLADAAIIALEMVRRPGFNYSPRRAHARVARLFQRASGIACWHHGATDIDDVIAICLHARGARYSVMASMGALNVKAGRNAFISFYARQ